MALDPLLDHLQDMLRHMHWADAVWFSVWERSGLQDEPDLLQRMQHTADVQMAFLMVLRGEDVQFPGGRPAPGFADLRTLTRGNHAAFADFFRTLAPEALTRGVRVPWITGPPCQVTVTEALTQVAMHTQHHRGQLMTRLKDLGGKPQNVDYIIWAWKNRPEGRWD